MSSRGKFLAFSILTTVFVSIIGSVFSVGRFIFYSVGTLLEWPFWNYIYPVVKGNANLSIAITIVLSLVVWFIVGWILGSIFYLVKVKRYGQARFTIPTAILLILIQGLIAVAFGLFGMFLTLSRIF